MSTELGVTVCREFSIFNVLLCTSVCNKQTFFVLFFVKLFVHFTQRFRGSFVPVYC